MISASDAEMLLYATHEAWNHRDIDRLLSLFVDDMTYWSNVDADGGETIITGKPDFIQFLGDLHQMQGLSVPHSFKFKDGVGTASVEFYLRDLRSGYAHSGTFRQMLRYRDGRVLRMEEYHDAPALHAYMQLLGATTAVS
jgi:ketosteroid isomerase-like protein